MFFYKNICIPGTAFSLMSYLLFVSEEEINETKFYTCGTIPQNVLNRIPHNTILNKCITKKTTYLYILKYKLLRYIVAPWFIWCKLYAQDHLPISPFLISQKKYTLLPDGPKYLSSVMKQDWVIKAWDNLKTRSKKQVMKDDFISKSMYGFYGKNRLCIDYIVTENEFVDYMRNRPCHLLDIKQKWMEASPSKKNLILKIFGISTNDIELLGKNKVILMTQPFVDDKLITEKEQIEIYRNAMRKYNMSDIVIKTHPRDKVDYSKYFDGALIFDKPIPSQLLNLLCPSFEVAITICSSSVFDIDYPINIDWIGTQVHPNLLASYGDVKIENFRKVVN